MLTVERHTQYKLSKRDLRVVLLCSARRKFKTKKFAIKLGLAWLVSMLAVLGVLGLLHDQFTLYNGFRTIMQVAILYILIIASLILLELCVVIPLKTWQLAKKSSFSSDVQTILWNEYGIAISTEKLKRSYPLRLFYGWENLSDYILLYLNERQYSILPKRAFAPEQLADLTAILLKILPQKS